MRLSRIYIPALAGMLLAPFLAVDSGAQEDIDAITARGYVQHWLVCGPFLPDAEGGIAAAIKDGRPLLGKTDFMAPIGGMAAARPQHLTEVKTSGDAKAIWQNAGATGPSLDLAPFFPDAPEGVAFAGFYVQAAQQSEVYADLQTPLGGRVFVNGRLVLNPRPAPISSTGLNRLLIRFRPGLNFVMIQVPGATFETLAKAEGVDLMEFKAAGFRNRPLLQGHSGYEIALRLLPARMFEGIAYVPLLQHTGSFSTGPEGQRQDAEFILFNAGKATSEPIGVTLDAGRHGGKIKTIVSPIPPNAQGSVLLPIPTQDAAEGDEIDVKLELTVNAKVERVALVFTVKSPESGGKVYIVTGDRVDEEFPPPQALATERHVTGFFRQIYLSERERDYGFDLGRMEHWKPALDMNPEVRDYLANALAFSKVMAWAGYGTPDERLAGPEVLCRNLLIGHQVSKSLLGDWNTAYVAWDAPGIALQGPQILARAGITGLVSNLDAQGLPSFSTLVAPDGSAILHRRKQPGPFPTSMEGLREMAEGQRSELKRMGIDADILVKKSLETLPEALWVGTTALLAHSAPAILLSGAGAREFFEDAGGAGHGRAAVPPIAPPSLAVKLGELASQPEIKQAYAAAYNRLLTAEKLAVIAGLQGAQYPEVSLDYAWRQLLHVAGPTSLGFSATPTTYLDTLGQLREVHEILGALTQGATDFLASQAETLEGAPEGSEQALLVFNPSLRVRTDVCEFNLTIPQANGLSLIDAAGAPVPFTADRLQVVNRKLVGARLRFLARSVPAAGYRTYFLQYKGVLATPETDDGLEIENDTLRIEVDPAKGGCITTLADKVTEAILVRAPWNDLYALDEDAGANDRGRDIWTSGAVLRSSESSASVSRVRTPWMQQLIVKQPFLGGESIRTITLYDALPVVFFDTEFRGIPPANALLGVAFPAHANGTVPVFGQPFGAQVAAASPTLFDHRLKGRENASATGLQPAYQWVAASPGDRLDGGAGVSVPLGPAAVIYGQDGIGKEAAFRIQAALARRGIPCRVHPDVLPARPAESGDSTESTTHDEDLFHGTVFRIVLGAPEQNRFAAPLFEQVPAEIAAFRERMAGGASLLMIDERVPAEIRPIPTLILAGLTGESTSEVADGFADAIAASGVFTLPTGAIVVPDPTPQPTHGFAVLLEGTGLADMAVDGTLSLAWVHPSKWAGADGAPAVPEYSDSLRYRYAVMPFDGSWRGAGAVLAGQAFNERFVVAATGIHEGTAPAEMGFFEVAPPSFAVTSVKAAGNSVSSLAGSPVTPGAGIAIRGYESSGKPVEVALTLPARPRSAAHGDIVETRGEDFSISGDRIVFDAAGFEIAGILLQPAAKTRRDAGQSLDPASLGGAQYTRYWRHNAGAAPPGFMPLTLKLSGDLKSETGAIDVVVANNRTDKRASGVVYLEGSAGWRLSPAQFEYDLAPREFLRRQAVVLYQQAGEAKGGVVARTDHDGRAYRDLITLDKSPLDLIALRDEDEIRVTVKNAGALPAEGQLELIVSPRYWGEPGLGGETIITPRAAALTVAPYNEQTLVFRSEGPPENPWIVAKLAANGLVEYRDVSVVPDKNETAPPEKRNN